MNGDLGKPLQTLECRFDEVFDLGGGVVFEEGGHDFGDGRLGEAEHDKSRGGFVYNGICAGLEDSIGRVGAGALDDLVFELQNEALGGFEADALDAFDLGDVLGKDGLADFVGGERGKHHAGGAGADAGDTDQEAE